ncbi:MAG: hypothetical protein KDA84_27985, partial [Planctomycetaceae bacterium]|nr:hypothetical protein [Planctomycetaceae bacterium]
VVLPKTWPDPLRTRDPRAPDVGAIPRGTEPWPVGIRGRLNVFGANHEPSRDYKPQPWTAPLEKETSSRRAVIIEGYPAFDAPLIAYGLRRRGIPVEVIERKWLEPKDFQNYDLVVIDGNFTRAGTKPDRFRPEDLPHLRQFLQAGGTLLLMRERTDLFATDQGRKFLMEIVGTGQREQQTELTILQKNHPWVRHLAGEKSPEWLRSKGMSPLRTSRGDVILGSPTGAAVLYRVPVGQGQLIYVGWTVASALPSGRKPSTVEAENKFETQATILWNILDDVFQSKRSKTNHLRD